MVSAFDRNISKWWVLLIFCFALFSFLLFPMLMGGKVLLADATEIVVPQLSFFKNAFAKGESPFWNPYVAVGFPNFISNLSSPFAPVVQLARILAPIDAHYWYLWFVLSLTLFFSIQFLRELGIGTWGSLIGGLSYIIGDFYWSQNAAVVNVLLVQVVLFWVIMRILKSSGWQTFVLYTAIGSLAVAWGWLTTVVYFGNLYIFTTLLAFVVFLGVKNGKIVLYRLSAALAISFLFGSLLGVLQLVPVYIMTQFSGRSAGLAHQVAQGYAIGLKEFLNFVYLTPRRGLEAYLYLGIAPLMFLFLSFFSKNPIAKFFRWVFLIALAISIKGSPLFWLIIQLPLFSYFQGAARFMLVGAFGGAVLVGFGTEYLAAQLKQAGATLVKQKIVIFAVVITIALIVVAVIQPSRLVIYSVLISAIFLALFFLSFLFFSKKPYFFAVLALITALDFVVVFYNFNLPFMVDRRDYEQVPATADFFSKSGGRIFPLFVEDWDDLYFSQTKHVGAPPEYQQQYALGLSRETYRPNFQLLNGVENLEVNEPLLNVEMGRLMALVGTRQLVTDGGEEKLNKFYFAKDGRDLSVVERVKIFKQRLPLVDFLGIKYILAPYDLKGGQVGALSLKLIGDASVYLLGKTSTPMPMFIYENLTARPLAYFTPAANFKTDPAEIYQLFKSGGFKGLFVECSDCAPEKFDGLGEVILTKRENGLVGLKTVSNNKQFLVFTQNYLPGWKAFIDGQEVGMYKVNTVFPGVFVPAGEHQVEFRYDYWSLFNPSLIFSKHINGEAY